jgi:hypothetical protein
MWWLGKRGGDGKEGRSAQEGGGGEAPGQHTQQAPGGSSSTLPRTCTAPAAACAAGTCPLCTAAMPPSAWALPRPPTPSRRAPPPPRATQSRRAGSRRGAAACGSWPSCLQVARQQARQHEAEGERAAVPGLPADTTTSETLQGALAGRCAAGVAELGSESKPGRHLGPTSPTPPPCLTCIVVLISQVLIHGPQTLCSSGRHTQRGAQPGSSNRPVRRALCPSPLAAACLAAGKEAAQRLPLPSSPPPPCALSPGCHSAACPPASAMSASRRIARRFCSCTAMWWLARAASYSKRYSRAACGTAPRRNVRGGRRSSPRARPAGSGRQNRQQGSKPRLRRARAPRCGGVGGGASFCGQLGGFGGCVCGLTISSRMRRSTSASSSCASSAAWNSPSCWKTRERAAAGSLQGGR